MPTKTPSGGAGPLPPMWPFLLLIAVALLLGIGHHGPWAEVAHRCAGFVEGAVQPVEAAG